MATTFNTELAKQPQKSFGAMLTEEALALTPLQKAQLGVDAAGLFDPTPISGAVSTAMSAYQLDPWGVVLGLAGMVPYLGDAGKLAKIAKIAPKTAKALDFALTGAKDFAKAGKDVLSKVFDFKQVVAARRKAAEAVQDLMKKKRIDPNCKECQEIARSRMPRSAPGRGRWKTADGKAPTDGNGIFEFETPKTLPDGKVVSSVEYKDGFPNFDASVVGGKHDIWNVTGDATTDANSLLRETGIRKPGEEYVLHHFENGEVGYVPRVLHDAADGGVAHTGGASIVNDPLY